MTGAAEMRRVPPDPGVVLAGVVEDLHQRLARNERWVRIGDVLRMIEPRADAGAQVSASTS